MICDLLKYTSFIRTVTWSRCVKIVCTWTMRGVQKCSRDTCTCIVKPSQLHVLALERIVKIHFFPFVPPTVIVVVPLAAGTYTSPPLFAAFSFRIVSCLFRCLFVTDLLFHCPCHNCLLDVPCVLDSQWQSDSTRPCPLLVVVAPVRILLVARPWTGLCACYSRKCVAAPFESVVFTFVPFEECALPSVAWLLSIMQNVFVSFLARLFSHCLVRHDVEHLTVCAV